LGTHWQHAFFTVPGGHAIAVQMPLHFWHRPLTHVEPSGHEPSLLQESTDGGFAVHCIKHTSHIGQLGSGWQVQASLGAQSASSWQLAGVGPPHA